MTALNNERAAELINYGLFLEFRTAQHERVSFVPLTTTSLMNQEPRCSPKQLAVVRHLVPRLYERREIGDMRLQYGWRPTGLAALSFGQLAVAAARFGLSHSTEKNLGTVAASFCIGTSCGLFNLHNILFKFDLDAYPRPDSYLFFPSFVLTSLGLGTAILVLALDSPMFSFDTVDIFNMLLWQSYVPTGFALPLAITSWAFDLFGTLRGLKIEN